MNDEIQSQIDSINRKLDIILEEIELQRRHRLEIEDLKDDLMRVGKDIYLSAVSELEEVHDQVSTVDFVYFGKKLLRNINNIARTFELMENAKDFMDDFYPLSRNIAQDIMARLDEFDKKGYFDVLRELGKTLDALMVNADINRMRELNANMGELLKLLQTIADPHNIKALNRALAVSGDSAGKDITYVQLWKQFRNPEVKRGLYLGAEFLKQYMQTKSQQSR